MFYLRNSSWRTKERKAKHDSFISRLQSFSHQISQDFLWELYQYKCLSSPSKVETSKIQKLTKQETQNSLGWEEPKQFSSSVTLLEFDNRLVILSLDLEAITEKKKEKRDIKIL